MLHLNRLRWCNLIGSLSQDTGQYPMIEISNSGRMFDGRLVTLKKFKIPGKKCYLVYYECSLVVYTKTSIHLRLHE